MSVDNSYLVIDLKKRKSNIFSCRFVMRKMRSLVSFEIETKRGKYVIPAAPCMYIPGRSGKWIFFGLHPC